MEKQEFVQKYPGDNLKAKEWNSLIECVNEIIDEVNSNADIISSNDESNNVEIKSEEGDIIIHSNGTSEQNNLNKIRFLHDEGLEFGTFTPKETSIYTNEYHFKKDGVIKLATRQENTLNGEIVSYESNIDKSYDDINPLDPQVTWNDILSIINIIKTSNISWNDIENIVNFIKNSDVTMSNVEDTIYNIRNSELNWNSIVSTAKYVNETRESNLMIDPLTGVKIEDKIVPGYYINGDYLYEMTYTEFNNNRPYTYIFIDLFVLYDDPEPLTTLQLPKVIHDSELLGFLGVTSLAGYDYVNLFRNLSDGGCVVFNCGDDRVLLGTKRSYQSSFNISTPEGGIPLYLMVNISNKLISFMTFGSPKSTYKFSVNVPGYNNTIDEDDQPYSTPHFYSPLTLTWFNNGLDAYYYSTYGKHIPLYDLSYINSDRFRVLDDYGNTTNIGLDMSEDFISEIILSYEPAIERGDLELTGTLLEYDLFRYSVYQLKDGDYFAIKCMYSAEYGQDYLVWVFLKKSPDVTLSYFSGDTVNFVDIAKLVNYMKTNNQGPWANV